MSQSRKIYWWTAALSVLILAAAWVIPAEPHDPTDLPWHIEHPQPDKLKIFGLTLGQSDTNAAEAHFQEEAKPSLFRSPDGKMVVEMFFEQVTLVGLKSRIVLTIDVPESELAGIYERGLRISGTGSGKKITMTTEDVAKIRTYPIGAITYMPSATIEETTFAKRFGQPAQKVREKESGVVHWLYPQIALDIAMGDGSRKPVLQYISPPHFERLRQPLLNNGEVIH